MNTCAGSRNPWSSNDTKLVEDYKGNKLLLFGAFWSIKWVADHNPQLVLTEFNERSEEEE